MSPTTPDSTIDSTDGELLAEFAARRSEKAFEELVRRHGGMVFSVCRSVLESNADADDAAQAVFLTLARKASSTSVQARLVGWLHRVAWYVASRAAEARAVRRRHEREAAKMRPELRVTNEDSVLSADLHAGLNDLPERDRVPLILHHIEGRSQRETAAILGCSEATVAVRLHRGREKLRKRLERRGVPGSAVLLATLWVTRSEAAVPEAFVASTTSAALGVSTTAGPVAALSQAALSMLFWAKVKTAVMLLLAVGAFAGLGSALDFQERGVSVAEPSSARGTIAWVEPDRLTLRNDDDGVIIVPVSDQTLVTHDDQTSSLASLRVGMSVKADVEAGQPATKVFATGSATLAKPQAPPGGFITGTIDRIDEGSLSLLRRGGEVVTVNIDDATAVRVDQQLSHAGKLRVRMNAVITLRDGESAHTVRAFTGPPPR